MEGLGIDIKLLIAQLINFFLFFLIFKKYIAKPFSSFIKNEIKKDEEKEKLFAEMKKKEEAMIEEEKKLKAKMKRDLEEAILKSKKEAKAYKEELIAQAKKEAEEIVKKAKKQIEAEKKELEKETKKKVIDLALIIVEKGLKNYLDEKTQKEINKKMMENLKKVVN